MFVSSWTVVRFFLNILGNREKVRFVGEVVGGVGRYFLLSANFVVAFAFVFGFVRLLTLCLGKSDVAMG